MTNLPIVHLTATVRDALNVIQHDGRGIALVVGRNDALAAVFTDGDARRAVLSGYRLDSRLIDMRLGLPTVGMADMEEDEWLDIMARSQVRQLPIIDTDGRVVSLYVLPSPEVHAVVMAGGYGTRLRPLTDNCPKPMLPVRGKPLLEHTLDRLREAGIGRVNVVTHYLEEQIFQHFGNGDSHGIQVRYVSEEAPLGTAGSLGMVEAEGPVLILNGDLLVNLDLRALISYHISERADITMVVSRRSWDVRYGVVLRTGDGPPQIVEKPRAELEVNEGIYVVEPHVRESIPAQPSHMTHVFNAVARMGRPVAFFPLIGDESCQDVGTPEDYRRAQGEVA